MTGVVLYGTIRLDSKIRFQIVHFYDSLWRQQTLAVTKLFLSLTRMDFAVGVSSRVVRVFPALSLRRVRPSYGTFSRMVLQGNYARGRTGHTIKYSLSLLLLVLDSIRHSKAFTKPQCWIGSPQKICTSCFGSVKR